ncbi:MAG: AbrB/MazE/SpoVT family DNA-binding domain-containing protein [Lysobacterales bacterium CG02_land_8_20_14_3_00_62_12]|nr:MAG: AbrB/MazE/SpoVT family DNA-binding domain-containing protein [Xanthomonadales bacterium CG02_land_8_20_14_3_00_62_12]
MRIAIRRIGNSLGLIIPRPLLGQLGLEDEVDLTLVDDAIILRKPGRPLRQGWAEASASIAAAGDDALVLPEFANAADQEWRW